MASDGFGFGCKCGTCYNVPKCQNMRKVRGYGCANFHPQGKWIKPDAAKGGNEDGARDGSRDAQGR